VSRHQKGKTNLDFTEARDSEWRLHQLGYMQVCTSFQTDNHASTPPLRFLQAGCPFCRPTNSVKAVAKQYNLGVLIMMSFSKTGISFSVMTLKPNHHRDVRHTFVSSKKPRYRHLPEGASLAPQ